MADKQNLKIGGKTFDIEEGEAELQGGQRGDLHLLLLQPQAGGGRRDLYITRYVRLILRSDISPATCRHLSP